MISRAFRRAVEQVVARLFGATEGHDHSGADWEGPKLNATGLSVPVFTPLTTPLSSTSWDGDAYSTTAKTLIDLSAVFSVPAGVKAVLVQVFIRDSASAAAGNDNHIILGPTNTADEGSQVACAGLTNDCWSRGMLVVPCDANGDIYYQTYASGAGTLDVYLYIWGYYL
mgnify:CR=1 FL=1